MQLAWVAILFTLTESVPFNVKNLLEKLSSENDANSHKIYDKLQQHRLKSTNYNRPPVILNFPGNRRFLNDESLSLKHLIQNLNIDQNDQVFVQSEDTDNLPDHTKLSDSNLNSDLYRDGLSKTILKPKKRKRYRIHIVHNQPTIGLTQEELVNESNGESDSYSRNAIKKETNTIGNQGIKNVGNILIKSTQHKVKENPETSSLRKPIIEVVESSPPVKKKVAKKIYDYNIPKYNNNGLSATKKQKKNKLSRKNFKVLLKQFLKIPHYSNLLINELLNDSKDTDSEEESNKEQENDLIADSDQEVVSPGQVEEKDNENVAEGWQGLPEPNKSLREFPSAPDNSFPNLPDADDNDDNEWSDEDEQTITSTEINPEEDLNDDLSESSETYNDDSNNDFDEYSIPNESENLNSTPSIEAEQQSPSDIDVVGNQQDDNSYEKIEDNSSSEDAIPDSDSDYDDAYNNDPMDVQEVQDTYSDNTEAPNPSNDDLVETEDENMHTDNILAPEVATESNENLNDSSTELNVENDSNTLKNEEDYSEATSLVGSDMHYLYTTENDAGESNIEPEISGDQSSDASEFLEPSDESSGADVYENTSKIPELPPILKQLTETKTEEPYSESVTPFINENEYDTSTLDNDKYNYSQEEITSIVSKDIVSVDTSLISKILGIVYEYVVSKDNAFKLISNFLDEFKLPLQKMFDLFVGKYHLSLNTVTYKLIRLIGILQELKKSEELQNVAVNFIVRIIKRFLDAFFNITTIENITKLIRVVIRVSEEYNLFSLEPTYCVPRRNLPIVLLLT